MVPEGTIWFVFFVVFGFGWLVGLGRAFVHLSFFWPAVSLTGQHNNTFLTSVRLLVGVRAAVRVCVGLVFVSRSAMAARARVQRSLPAASAAPVLQHPRGWGQHCVLLLLPQLSHLLCQVLGFQHHWCPGSSSKANGLSPSALQRYACSSEVH